MEMITLECVSSSKWEKMNMTQNAPRTKIATTKQIATKSSALLLSVVLFCNTLIYDVCIELYQQQFIHF